MAKMSNDLELIKQLEIEISKKLKKRKFDEIDEFWINGFSTDENGHVIGLNLDNINLKHLPVTLLKFKHLQLLHLFRTELTDISFLQSLSDLTNLNLSRNEIIDISFLQGLKNLTTLDLIDNKIIELPEAIVDLGMKIDVDSNGVKGEGLYLFGNPLEKPPIEIVRKGKDAIKAYFKSLKKEKKSLNEVKVLLVGDGGAGKTSLMKRLLDEGFDRNEPQTHGININHKWEVTTEKTIKINLWDFGEQEIMHATHQFFLSKRSLYVLVLDGRKDEKVEYWLQHIQRCGGDSPVLVVLNKIDQNPAFDVNRIFLQEKYKNIRGFFRVSCAINEGIKDFSKHLINELAKVEMIKTMWANSWFRVKTRLEKMSEDFISYDQYKILCQEENITDKISRDTLVDYFNDLGVILHFKDFRLEETHVLNPEWVTTAVYKIINCVELVESKGVLNLRLLEKILEKRKEDDYYYPRDKHRYIIDLMKKFELCYGIDEETVLIPDLLAVQEPHIEFNDADALKFIIEYEFLPRSVMPRFIVNMHINIKNMLQWRTGVVLENKDLQSTAVVKADYEAKRIYIHVEGGQRRDYFAVILAALRSINKSFEKLETRELVPMPDNPKITASYRQLIRFEEEGIEYYLPGETEKRYKVKDLLGTIGEKIEEDETLQMLRTIKTAQLQRKSDKNGQ
jgi:small GTP-binding protein